MKNLRLIAEKLCVKNDCRLIYLSMSGSHRLGTTTPTSDIDLEGIFIPPKEKLLLCERIDYLSYSTGWDRLKNTFDDIDMKLYSIQYFLNNLLRVADINAIDILYSHTNENTVISMDDPMPEIFNNKHRILEVSDVMNFSYVAYAIDQAKRYGVKGTRLGVIRRVLKTVEDIKLNIGPLDNFKLRDCMDVIISFNKDLLDKPDKYLFLHEQDGSKFLVLCGKMHQLSIPMEEFYKRIKSDFFKYGDRAKQAEENKGIDWKAISHAVRSIYQMEELCSTGSIKFPLDRASEILEIKLGKHDWKTVNKIIADGLDRLGNLNPETINFNGVRDETYINNLILHEYKHEERQLRDGSLF